MLRRLLWLFAAVCALVNHASFAADRLINQVSATASDLSDVLTEYREFEIRVDNKSMGVHSLNIRSDGDKHEVEMKSDVKVDFIVYAYVFKFRGKEVWRDGQVVFSDIHTEDGGKKRDFYYKTDGKAHQIQFNGKPMPAELPGRMSTAYWMLPAEDHRKKPFTILDVDTGNARTASIKLVEEDTLNYAGRSIVCQHYKVEGPSPAELWFDKTNRMVRQTSVEQGHPMELRLRKIESSKDAR